MSACPPRPGLADLLDPVPVHTFLSEHWGRRPLLVRGDRAKFAGLLDLDRFAAAVREGERAGAPGFRLAALRPARPDEPLTSGSTEVIRQADVEAEIAAGTTICVTDISAGDAALGALARRVRSEIGLPGDVRFNCFLSPPGSGADLHLDARVTMSLQLQGSKRWWYGEQVAVPWPLSNAQLLPDGRPVWMYPWRGGADWEDLAPVRRDELTQVVLEPGDLLCLPAGTWHAARAVQTSLALNLSFSPPDLLEFLRCLLEELMLDSAEWRGDLPVSADSTSDAPAPVVSSFLVARIRDAAAALAALPEDSPLPGLVWRRLCGRPPAVGPGGADGRA